MRNLILYVRWKLSESLIIAIRDKYYIPSKSIFSSWFIRYFSFYFSFCDIGIFSIMHCNITNCHSIPVFKIFKHLQNPLDFYRRFEPFYESPGQSVPRNKFQSTILDDHIRSGLFVRLYRLVSDQFLHIGCLDLIELHIDLTHREAKNLRSLSELTSIGSCKF